MSSTPWTAITNRRAPGEAPHALRSEDQSDADRGDDHSHRDAESSRDTAALRNRQKYQHRKKEGDSC
jgi:hypothetical protein